MSRIEGSHEVRAYPASDEEKHAAALCVAVQVAGVHPTPESLADAKRVLQALGLAPYIGRIYNHHTGWSKQVQR